MFPPVPSPVVRPMPVPRSPSPLAGCPICDDKLLFMLESPSGTSCYCLSSDVNAVIEDEYGQEPDQKPNTGNAGNPGSRACSVS